MSEIGDRWYHGTVHPFRVGDIVLPANEIGVVRIHPDHHDGSDVHISNKLLRAWQYASLAKKETGFRPGVDGLIFEVEPLGPVEEIDYPDEFTTTSARVLAKVDWPPKGAPDGIGEVQA